MTIAIRISGQEGTQAFTGEFTVGRDDGADITLDDEYASSHHAVFRPSLQKYWTVEDLGSVNGTWLNGYRVRGRSWLFRGDKVKIGRTILIVDPIVPP